MLFRAVAVLDFLVTGVGGSEASGAGALRLPEPEALCTVCAMQVRLSYQHSVSIGVSRNEKAREQQWLRQALEL